MSLRSIHKKRVNLASDYNNLVFYKKMLILEFHKTFTKHSLEYSDLRAKLDILNSGIKISVSKLRYYKKLYKTIQKEKSCI